MMRVGLIILLALQNGGSKLRYGAEKTEKDRISTEQKLTIKLEGTEAALNFVRTMHPMLSLEKLVIRAEGTRQIVGKNKHKHEYDEARVEARYDDEDLELDYQKGQPPSPDLGKSKMRQFMYYVAAGGKNFTLTPEGEYRSDQADQDHNGEAMDLVALAVTRMPDKPVKEGDRWEKSWTGSRTEKNKQAKYAFTQKVTVEKIEMKEGKKLATLVSDLTGKVNAPPNEKDKSAEEAWTKLEGKTRLVLEVESGRILSCEGAGKVVGYFRAPAEDGGKNEITMTFGIEGKTTVK